MRRNFWLLGTLAIAVNTFVLTTSLYSQIFGTGPSDPDLFRTVTNVGSDFPPVNIQVILQNIQEEKPLQVNVLDGSITAFFVNNVVGTDVEFNINGGDILGSTAVTNGELNLISGTIEFRLDAFENSQVNISGGVIGAGLNGTQASLFAQFGSEVNISGGSIASNVSASEGSSVHITGGNFGLLSASPGSDVSLNGGEFILNGNPFMGESIELSNGDLFTGTLEDGSAFELHFSFFGNGPICLNTVALPAADLTPFVVNTVNPGPSGLRAGQSLTLQEGGDLGRNFEVIDATINVEGGIVGDGFGAHRSEVTISGGTFGQFFWATEGSVVDISGGRFGPSIFSRSFFEADVGSVVNISGGVFGDRFRAEAGSNVVISGGAFGDEFLAFPGTVELVGGEFKLNGEDYKGETFTLNDSDELTGTLADGSAFIFCGEMFEGLNRTGGDVLLDVTLTNVVLPEIDTTPITVSESLPDIPSGLRAGQTLTLVEGGELEAHFEVVDATFNIQGGILGCGGRATRSEVNISGGDLGGFYVGPESRVDISGGLIQKFLTALEGSVLNIGGGELTAGGVTALAGSELNIFGSEFFLDGEAIDFQGAQTIEITEQGNVLSGTLSDGSSFTYRFNAPGIGAFLSPDATLTVNLGSIPPRVLVGDVSLDGAINFSDISPFVSVLSVNGFQAEADIDGNGSVNFQDIMPFIALLLGNG